MIIGRGNTITTGKFTTIHVNMLIHTIHILEIALHSDLPPKAAVLPMRVPARGRDQADDASKATELASVGRATAATSPRHLPRASTPRCTA